MSCASVPHYHGAIETEPELLDNYKGRKGYFLKKFLINDKFNLNDWRVTWDGMKLDIRSFIGQPLTLTPKLDHPSVKKQEHYKVGTIIDVGLNEILHNAWQITQLKDKKTYELFRSKTIRYGSPTVHSPKRFVEITDKGTPFQKTILHRFIGKHDATVEEPAYTKLVDKVVAVCEGDGPACGSKLLEVDAEVNDTAIDQITVPQFIKKKTAQLTGRLWQIERRQAALLSGKDDEGGRWVTMPNGEPVFIKDGIDPGKQIREHFRKRDAPKSESVHKNLKNLLENHLSKKTEVIKNRHLKDTDGGTEMRKELQKIQQERKRKDVGLSKFRTLIFDKTPEKGKEFIDLYNERVTDYLQDRGKTPALNN